MSRRTPRIIALIPARGGSRGVPRKNLRPLAGHPLLAYSILAARQCREIERVLVSTDDPEIGACARQYGADTPFLRPRELARDDSSACDVVRHFVRWLAEEYLSPPELVAVLLPTTPLRAPDLLSTAIAELRADPAATGLRSVQPLPEPPQKMMGIAAERLVGLFPDDPRPEYYNLPRQSFPPAYHPNGYIELIRPEVVAGTGTMYGPRIRPFITPVVTEIDTFEEFDYLEYQIARHGHPLREALENPVNRTACAGRNV